MAGRAEEFFGQLKDAAAISALIGQPEDSHFDCKEWPAKEDDAQKMLAKSASGMTNAEGGVLVIGMKAESKPKDEPDVVSAVAPVSDTSFVKSRVLGLISNLVEPGIVGVEAVEIKDRPESKSGFVVVYIPKSEGSPRRSRKDLKFYQRIGSATLPMEYWQIEDMFGKRPHAKLGLYLEARQVQPAYNLTPKPKRTIVFGLKNDGTSIAKFPGIRFRSHMGLTIDSSGIDGKMGFGIPRRSSENDWFVFRGGVDDVIYAGEIRLIGKLVQAGYDGGIADVPTTTMAVIVNNRIAKTRFVFHRIDFTCEVSCEGVSTMTIEHAIPEDAFVASL